MKPVYTIRVALLILVNLSCLLGPSHLLAEGTKQVMPNSTQGTGLIVSTTSSFPLGNVGSYLGAPVDQRIYFYVKDWQNESLYYGFHWETLAPSGTINVYNNVYMRVYDPTGAQVGSPILMPTTGNGYLSTYNLAATGPSIGGSPFGYKALTFKPAMNGGLLCLLLPEQ
jgi:hypothetical protein